MASMVNGFSFIQSAPEDAPSAEVLREALLLWRPRDGYGVRSVATGVGLAGVGLGLAALGGVAGWLVGQVLIAFAGLTWFALLHEAGHGTLFRRRAWNHAVGHVAGWLTAIPYPTWRIVHRLHHRWTGWQDLDPTTAVLVRDRPVGWRRAVVRGAWAGWIPLFSVIYRWSNLWNLRRLRRWIPDPCIRRRLALTHTLQAVITLAVVVLIGPVALLQTLGVGILLGLALQDVLILSQHTHVPMNRSGGRSVQPVPATRQAPFTRGLRVPGWLSHSVLLHLDRHDLHHVAPALPGYALGRIAWRGSNTRPWRSWVRDARSTPGDVFLFDDRNHSGRSML